jgi:hypothetical protein
MTICLPRIILAEFNTHRVLSRNSASSRAIPTYKQLLAIVKDTFRPEEFGTAVGGMNAGEPLEGEKLANAQTTWNEAAFNAVWVAMCLTTSPEYIEREWDKWSTEKDDNFDDFALDIARRIEDKKNAIHQEALLWTTKGLTNRLLEPFMWHTIIVTATEWDNFFNLRTDMEAQLEIRTAAKMMKAAYDASEPVLLQEGEWHLPFIQPHEVEWAKENPEIARKAVTARCARVSYLTHDKKIIDIDNDIRLADSLAKNGHMSPFEHAATPFMEVEWLAREEQIAIAAKYEALLPKYVTDDLAALPEFSGNFRGWGQFRREQKNHSVFVREPANVAA